LLLIGNIVTNYHSGDNHIHIYQIISDGNLYYIDYYDGELMEDWWAYPVEGLGENEII